MSIYKKGKIAECNLYKLIDMDKYLEDKLLGILPDKDNNHLNKKYKHLETNIFCIYCHMVDIHCRLAQLRKGML